MSEIDDIFDDFVTDSWSYIDNVSKIFLHETTKMAAETWANEIIGILTSGSLPELNARTIQRRITRQKSMLGPDYPLLETGEWATFIEFRIKQYDRHDDLEVGVFDESSQIGHTGNATPAYIAKINEYGFEDIIPIRAPFATSETIMQGKLDKIITESWRQLPAKIKNSDFTFSSNSLVGRIFSTGSGFVFRWDS
jgi:hypothetical protein